MIITIASPDKLSLSMFSDFYKTIYNSDIKIIDINCLFSSDLIENKVNEIKNIKSRDVLIKFKMKNQTKEIASIIVENSDVVIKFDIFSTEPEVIKSNKNDLSAVIDRWKSNIDKFNSVKLY